MLKPYCVRRRGEKRGQLAGQSDWFGGTGEVCDVGGCNGGPILTADTWHTLSMALDSVTRRPPASRPSYAGTPHLHSAPSAMHEQALL
jgi:hypothetical protein